jgi:hypothetical protein
MQIYIDLALNQDVPTYEVVICNNAHSRLVNSVLINSTFITMNGATTTLFGCTFNETDTNNTWPSYSMSGINNVTVSCIYDTSPLELEYIG